MNILFVLEKFPSVGGTETVTATLSDEFIKRGHRVHIISSQQMPFKKLCSVQFLHNFIIEKSIDILINQAVQMEYVYLCSKARKRTNAKFIQVHHFDFFRLLNKKMSFKAKIFPEFLSKKIKKFIQVMEHKIKEDLSDRYVFLSENYVREFLKYGESNKILAIANPIEINEFSYLFENDKKRNTILFVGRMIDTQKRISLMLKAWKIISAKKEFENWNFILVGDGEDLQKLRDIACNLSNVHFEGYQKPKQYYIEAKIFLMCSEANFEGLPMTLIETQKFGCVPVAMNTFETLQDVILNGENGIISKDNLDDWTSKIELLMRDDELRERLAKNGMESIKKFDIAVIADKWEKLFEELRGEIYR